MKDHTQITALRQCWMVSRCQTPPLISIMSIILDQSKTFHVNLQNIYFKEINTLIYLKIL